MKQNIFLIIGLAITSCASPTEKVVVEEKDTIKTVIKEVLNKEEGPIALIKEQLSGFYDVDQVTNIVNQVMLNDSISYAISQTNDGICNTYYLHVFKGKKGIGLVEISKKCTHDISVPFATHMDYLKIDNSVYLITEYVEFVNKDSLDYMGEMEKSYRDYSKTRDTMILKLTIYGDGKTNLEQVKGFSSYKRPSFEKEDHEEDYKNVYLVIVDTGADYFSLNKKMYSIRKNFNIKVDTLDRFYNKKTDKLMLPENHEDEIYAGDYMPRRTSSSTLSIEYYGFYSSTANDNSFALVAGIFPKKKDATKVESTLKNTYKNCYVLQSKIFMGCMH